MLSSPALLARIIHVEAVPGQDGMLRAASPELPNLAAEASDAEALFQVLPQAIRRALMAEEPCVALPVGRFSGPAGEWVAIPDALAALSLAA